MFCRSSTFVEAAVINAPHLLRLQEDKDLQVKWCDWKKLTFSPVKACPTRRLCSARPPCVKIKSKEKWLKVYTPTLRHVHCFQSEPITGGHSVSADQKERTSRRVLCSGPLIGRPEVALAFYSVAVWPVPCGLLSCVCDDLSDDLRHIVCPAAEGPFVLTDHHMNFFLRAPLLPPYVCFLHSHKKALANNYIPHIARSF